MCVCAGGVWGVDLNPCIIFQHIPPREYFVCNYCLFPHTGGGHQTDLQRWEHTCCLWSSENVTWVGVGELRLIPRNRMRVQKKKKKRNEMFVHSLNLEKFPSQLFSQLSFQMGFLLLSHACWPTEVCECACQLLISVQVFVNPWTVARQAPLSIESSRQEQWSGLPFPSPGHLPNPGIEPGSPALQTDSLPSESPGKPKTEVQFFCFFF